MDIWNQLFRAIQTGNVNEFSKLIQSSECKWTQIETKYLDNFYRYASILKKKKIGYTFAELMISSGAPVTSQSILYAIRAGQLSVVELFLRNATDNIKRSCDALDACAAFKRSKSKGMIELLLKHGYDIDILRRDKRLPLVSAVCNKNKDVIETLLLHGANPCIHCVFKHGSALHCAFTFSLQMSMREKLVKYAVLHIDFMNDQERKKFFQSFSCYKKARPYFNFAKSCVAEAVCLKGIELNSMKLTLFNFMLSQGEQFRFFLDDLKITDKLFYVLASTSLPIYKEEILRKVGRNHILRSFSKFSCMSLYASYYDKKVTLHTDCVTSICKFLPTKDLISFWIAMTIT